MNDIITITIDGRTVRAQNRAMLLDVLNEERIYVPQLCNYPSLTPSGACRLCVVEVTKEQWRGPGRIVTSCLYPAEEGLIVSTRSPEVLKTRRSLLELYLARCPSAEKIQELARLEGIDTTSFAVKEDGDNCILCGLCTRVCQDCGPGAITTLSRGVDKIIGPDPGGVAADCTGCRTCAFICPTGAIEMKQEEGRLQIWNRSFPVPVCSVDQELCRACGLCEEVCPEDIPRVTINPDGSSAARIADTACTGCGICFGACPTGAINQDKQEILSDYEEVLLQTDLSGKTVIFKCSRSPMPVETENVYEVGCVGSIDSSTLLYCVAAGAKGAALVCRDRISCPYRCGGEQGEATVETAGALLRLCGLETDRIAYIRPEPGQEGPARSREEFIASLTALPQTLRSFYRPGKDFSFNLDAALMLVDWLKHKPELTPRLPEDLAALFAAGDQVPAAALYLGRLPELHLLLQPLLAEQPVSAIIADTSAFLKTQGYKSIAPALTAAGAAGHDRIIALSPRDTRDFPAGSKVITLQDIAGQQELTEQQAITEQIAEEELHGFSFRLTPANRAALLDRYLHSPAPYPVATPELYLQYKLLLRPGSWQISTAPYPEFSIAPATSDRSATVVKEGDRRRIFKHPILPPLNRQKLGFTFNGRPYCALEGEVITSALYAAGITVFGHHARDDGPQGIYCVNGQCSQCMVIADGKPVKGCMTPVREGMMVESVEGLPALSDDTPLPEKMPAPPETEVDVLIIGGGPAGISAAIELGEVGIDVLIIDDKQELGGKLSLQTHNFFGSVSDCYAGDRGVEIGHHLAADMLRLPTVKTWLNATVVGVFSDGKFGIATNNAFRLVRAKKTLFATGAREKSLAITGCDLPGVYGAGAFQTLVNRDLVKCAEKLFIIGGGNVGLIGAYHALQAGIDVVGLVEALPQCGGYKVHEDKIKRLGVPVMTSHTVLRIEGREEVQRVVIAAVDEKFQPRPGTERSFSVDTVLMAVGLSPVDEILEKAKEYGLDVYAAGDAEEIAEASAAIFSGKITGRKIAQDLGVDRPIPGNWESFGEILKQHGHEASPFEAKDRPDSVFPLIRCVQEIPCNPCTEACPNHCISMPGSILALPEFSRECIGCGGCVLACPGLAINLLINDYDPRREKALLMLPFEFNPDLVPIGREVTTTGMEGEIVGTGKVLAYKERTAQNSRLLLLLEVPYGDRLKVAGFKIREASEGLPLVEKPEKDEDPIVCRCERVRKHEIVAAVREGVRDMNQLKALNRAGLGGCNGKTCTDLILRIFREEGVPMEEITMPTHRPLVAEVHLGDFIAEEREEDRGNAQNEHEIR